MTKLLVYLFLCCCVTFPPFLTNGQKSKNFDYEIADTFQSDVENVLPEFKHFLNEKEWFYLSKNNPIELTIVNLKTREREKIQYGESENHKIYLQSIYADSQQIMIVLDDKAIHYNRLDKRFKTITFDNDYQFKDCGIKNDTAIFYGAYNFHPGDGYPMLQLGAYDLKKNKWIQNKRHFFSGIFYTHFVGNLLNYWDGKLYSIEPISNYIKIYDYTLEVIDSIAIEKNVTINKPDFYRQYDLETHKSISQRKKKRSKWKYLFDKNEIMNIKLNDSVIFRNEKLIINQDFIMLTRKPQNYAGWDLRDIFIINKVTGKVLYKKEIEYKENVDYFAPIYMNSGGNFLINHSTFSFINSYSFYSKDVKDYDEYLEKLDEWALNTAKHCYTLFLFKLKL